MRIWIYCFLFFILLGCVQRHVLTIEDVRLKNFYKVDDSLYRSAQPSTKQMKFLSNNGIKTVVNLRLFWNDEREVKNTNLILIDQKMNTNKISYSDIVETMKVIRTAKKPVLIHCLHGSDRTGCMVAAYRMVYSGWTKEAAIKELQEERFGYHEKWFPNILVLLKALNVDQLKKELGISGQL